MHTPLEMIGWDEVDKDYIFLKPVMESMGIPIENEQELIDDYKKQQVLFFSDKKINGPEDLPEKLPLIRDEYPALSGYSKEEKAMFNVENNAPMVEAIVKKSGIGDLRESIVNTHEQSKGKLEKMREELLKYEEEGRRLKEIPLPERNRETQSQSYGE